MTEKEIQEHRDKIGFKLPDGTYSNFPSKMVRLLGWTSTTENKDIGYGYAWENQEKQQVRVVYQIHFRRENGYYVMDMGDYGYEKEVLLFDGLKFVVQSVKEDTDKKGNKIALITLQYYGVYRTSKLGDVIERLNFLMDQPITALKTAYK